MNILGTTQVYGIFGDPVEHSLSPVMQNAAFRALSIDGVYVPFHVVPSDLEQAVGAIRSMAIAGVNVTVPHKEVVLPLLDAVDETAQAIGAVNTIVNRKGQLTGFNTDGIGFINALGEDLSFVPKDQAVLMLGAGGASRAGVFSLAEKGARQIFLANRTLAKAEVLAEAVMKLWPQTEVVPLALETEALEAVIDCVSLIVNSVSAGLSGEGISGFPWQKVPSSTCFFDMLYSPAETIMVSTARQFGLQAVDGMGMLAGQGEEAFRLWTGIAPPHGLMREQLQFRRTQTS